MATISNLATGDYITETWTDSVTNAINNFDTYVSYTPTVTGVTAGNAVISAYYVQIGKFVWFRASWVFGSTSAVTGAIVFTLPVTAISQNGGMGSQINGTFFDNSAGTTYRSMVGTTTTTAVMAAENSAGTYVTNTTTSSTIPFTWATSDIAQVAGWYIAA